ncbi:sugar ABC transporter ATP-binding protein [Pelagicoccus sp. SDUM812002]|uniref:sugar ABC transporter ATP-binding protein n=1 Tax=Pelagicoccus sp. SDUM812002 TaxID=3041266 RepID=UPI00280F564B|nr:sugar ABC transporter ATP-binding protein [Pelagicoccus sp. SDUM812002]MDQ8184451.1 sugar ABC transporter ATP-binding protein [Pelagicoccus sp. SDUM812002]
MRGICKSFGATHALRDVELTVMPGEVMALVGENGAGKSTLMKVLSGAHAPDKGQLKLDGEIYTPGNPLHARESGVAMIYQELSLAPHLSAMENILLGIEPCCRGLIKWKEMKDKAAEALAIVGLHLVKPETLVSRLSIAQQQLVEIARAVALDCRVLVLDEPSSSLTAKDIEKLFELVRSLASKDISVVYISHFLEEVKALSQRFTVLRDGKTVGGGITKDAAEEDIISLMVGRDVDDLYPRNHHTPGEIVLEADSVARTVKPRHASFQLRKGEVLGIAGLVGAGRTELFEAIFGLEAITSGSVTVAGQPGPATPALRWSQGMGMVSEDRKSQGLALGLSIADNLTLPKLDGLGPGRLVMPARQLKACDPWIEQIPIKCRSAQQPISDLSGGNQQKVAIARLLHADVDILLLDEPTRGIDVGSKAQIYKLIDALARGDIEKGIEPKAVLIISSYIPELIGVCDRISVMCRGHLSEAKPTADWTEHSIMAAAIGQD